MRVFSGVNASKSLHKAGVWHGIDRNSFAGIIREGYRSYRAAADPGYGSLLLTLVSSRIIWRSGISPRDEPEVSDEDPSPDKEPYKEKKLSDVCLPDCGVIVSQQVLAE